MNDGFLDVKTVDMIIRIPFLLSNLLLFAAIKCFEVHRFSLNLLDFDNGCLNEKDYNLVHFEVISYENTAFLRNTHV